jgi:hypothetical protein
MYCIALLCLQPALALAGIIGLRRRVYRFLIAALVCHVMEQERAINQFPACDVLERGSERTEQATAKGCVKWYTALSYTILAVERTTSRKQIKEFTPRRDISDKALFPELPDIL